MKRVATALVVSVAASLCFAQISTDEAAIQDGFARIRTEPQVMFALDGTEQVGTKTNAIYCNAFFSFDPTTDTKPAKAEVNEFLNGVHTRRITADGVTAWGYDFARNTYTSFRYGSYSGNQTQAARADMLQEVTSQSRGQSIFLARMLREIYSGGVAQYRTWMPLAQITVVSKTSTTTQLVDPVIKTRTYDSDDLNFYVVYSYNTRMQRSAAFHFTRADLTQPWSLSEIYYADRQPLKGTISRTIDWRITVYTGILPMTTNYVFVPPSNSRAISNSRGQIGGG